MLELDRDKAGVKLPGATAINISSESRGHLGSAEPRAATSALPSAASMTLPEPAVLIRDAEDSDAAGLAQIVAAIMGEFPGCIFDLEADFPELKKPKTSFKKEGGRLWVAERHQPSAPTGRGGQSRKGSGEIVGCFGFLPAEDPSGIELLRVYLQPDLRGSGLATKMFKIVQAVARQRSANFIELWTDSRFKAAQRFYEKLGFTKLPDERLLNDRSLSSEYHYLLRLS
jgi:putative acetyltransferase